MQHPNQNHQSWEPLECSSALCSPRILAQATSSIAAGMGAEIVIIGTGYVGLTTGTCLAHIGHRVRCVDIDAAKVERLSRGEIPIVEVGLAELVRANVHAQRLTFTTDAIEAVDGAEFVFLCLPTPQDADGSADLHFVRDAATAIGPHLSSGAIVVNKSTVPVGSAGVVAEVLGRDDVTVVSNPEFLREGTAVDDFLHPDRVVIGADDPAAAQRLVDVYADLHAPALVTDPASAEMIKYASNAFLATKLSYVNAIAEICEAVGADIDDVTHGMGLDPRVGAPFLQPGPGWGGSCFPKDSAALVKTASEFGVDFSLLRSTISTNEAQFDRIASKIVDAAGGNVHGVRIAVWGLTFKAGTDDLRDSPALAIVARLVEAGAIVQAFDPTVSKAPRPGVEVAADAYSACQGAEVLAVLTEWPEFAQLDFDKVAGLLAKRNVVDARNVLDRKALTASGFKLDSIGKAG